ncbi:alpha-glucan family phosphorylase [bacterium]|nr:alpha-glucan family phosphorylase [bacterium]
MMKKQPLKLFSREQPVAYFSAEFAVDNSLPIYAGGLGVLAGDILKQAADDGMHMVGIGLLYKGEAARQEITTEGNQEEADVNFDPAAHDLELVRAAQGEPLLVKVNLTQVDVWVQVWRKRLGATVDLYLLDPDNEHNHAHERRQAWAIYAGTQEEIIKQQLILGIGGVKMLHALGIKPALFHVNEGRPSFLHWQLIRQEMDLHGLDYKKARALAIAKTVYTNHTVVKAGNQTYDLDMMKAYTKYYARKIGISVDELLEPGRDGDRFDVTQFALNTSGRASSVSQPHFDICQQNWPAYNWVNVTNGVHHPTWVDPRFSLPKMTDDDLWRYHNENKAATETLIKRRTGFGYDPSALVITWARRFATYKQPDAIFRDIERLQKLLLSTNRPVQLLMAGKAHVFDTGAKRLIRQIIGYMSQELRFHALFVPNYDMEMGAALTRGSDVWLNTPRVGEEASGTSGMKAAANGVLQLTTVDGWTAEIDWSDEKKGWALAYPAVTESFFEIMDSKVLPDFYQRDEAGLPRKWLRRMRESIKMAAAYSAARMMQDYSDRLYTILDEQEA